MMQLAPLEEEILHTVRENKPMTIAQLKETMYGVTSPHPDFYHDLNYLIVYRRALKIKNGKIIEYYKVLKPLKDDFFAQLCSECPIHLITKVKDDAVA